MDPGLIKLLKKQGYYTVGEHGAVKLCHWLSESLLKQRPCYKQLFYGIESHRCMQVAPGVDLCDQRCLFCWRYYEKESSTVVWDDPQTLLDGFIEGQKKLVSGFRGDPRCPPKRWEDARNPKHVAISLSGEPTLYPYLNELLAEISRRDMTSFLVTNGTMPDALLNLSNLPTQLYITIAAPDEATYQSLCRPSGEYWSKIKRSLEILSDMKTRKTIRHTLVKGLNMSDIDGYAKLDSMAMPEFIEAKGYVFVGGSRYRLTIDRMPSHNDVREFAGGLADRLDYRIFAEDPKSRVVLLVRNDVNSPEL